MVKKVLNIGGSTTEPGFKQLPNMLYGKIKKIATFSSLTKSKPVQVGIESVPGYVPTVNPVLLFTVNCIVCHAWINPNDDGSDGVPVLVEKKLK